jgi:hypothetical protein
LVGYDTSAISWLNGVRALGFASGAAGARRFLSARPSRQVVLAGHSAVALSCAIVGYGAHTSSAPWFIGGLVLGAFGTGFGRPSLATSITNAVGAGDAGVANGANNMAHQVGASVGQTTLIAIAAAGAPGDVAVACVVAAGLATASLATAARLR